MRRSMRLKTLGAIIALGAVVLAGCSGSPKPAETEKEKTPTTFVFIDPVNTLDPVLSTTIQNDIPADLMYDSVVDFDPDGAIRPRVATEWRIADDSLSIELTIRDDITFTDGTALTAKDVAYSLDRSVATGTGVAGLLTNYASAEVEDDQHLTIDLKSPDATFVGVLSKVYVLNSAEVSKHEGTDHAQAWLAANAAGSGAYTPTSYTQSAIVKLALNEDYWAPLDGRPTTFVVQNITEPTAIATALRSGSANLSILPHSEITGFENDPKFKTQQVHSPGGNYLFFNTQKGFTADPRVREAIGLAFDYEAFLKTTLGGVGDLATQLGNPLLGYSADLPDPKMDLQRAKKLVEEAGATGATLTMVYQPTRTDQQPAALLLQSGLKKIGIELTLQSTTFPNYLTSLSSIDTTPDIAIASEYPRFPDAQALLGTMLSSKFVGKGSNKSQYSNPKVDELLAEAASTTDLKDRQKIYVEIEQLVADDFAIRPINTLIWEYAMSANVDGVQANPARVVLDPMAITVQ